MSASVVCALKPYIQPFERALALQELQALAKGSPCPIPADGASGEQEALVFQVQTDLSAAYLASRLTYWQTVGVAGDGAPVVTRQVRREATSNLVRNGISPLQLTELLPFKQSVPLPNHRNLRYGPHGIHEYRGKFFPQLVRSLLNVAGADSRSVALDPMCGSGTTLVEASLLGVQALGLDMNPLSVLITRAKCGAIGLAPGRLTAEYESLKRALLQLPDARAGDPQPWFEHLMEDDRQYLLRWFSPEALAGLDPIAQRVSLVEDAACRDLFTVCLSNILRRVSWQKDDDLRVRKEVRADRDLDVLTEFLNELNRSVRAILALNLENHGCHLGQTTAQEGDARNAGAILRDYAGKVDVVVTSPPYATALPYLDTDRLSLSYLGLLSKRQHRMRDLAMIGNREVTEGQRNAYWESYQSEKESLPVGARELVERIAALNNARPAGFRRRNLPALLARYFLDMKRVFASLQPLLAPSAHVFVVIGTNYTIAGDQRIDIATDELLAQLAVDLGYSLEGKQPMEMLLSRDIFKKNASEAETILHLRKA
jgi:site-specific DNA-methyltransferase (cytosine-N4-specific)